MSLFLANYWAYVELDVSETGIFGVIIEGRAVGSTPTDFGMFAVDDFKSTPGKYVLNVHGVIKYHTDSWLMPT